MNNVGQFGLSFDSWDVSGSSKSRLCDEQVWSRRRELRRTQVSVLFPRVITCKEKLEASELDKEHCGSQHMAGMVCGKSDTLHLDGGMIVDGFNSVERLVEVLVGVEEIGRVFVVVVGNACNSDKVVQQPFIDCLCGIRHEHSTFKVCVLHHVWQRGRVVEVEMTNQQDVYFGEVEVVVEGQRLCPRKRRVNARVQHHHLSLILDNVAGAADFVSSAQTVKVQLFGHG
ncbi:hypothetical protein OGAPHI_005613 [Ogataea philodendri]|uniref:Uncharacterized protein n=1 Tax=Ogataea philodendri TaxID=1378263 RepID=A0A9P8T251_9ASCO|nr:uncharacterized protein OGAPHI_005613 [Ogataea philodendri]KAH3662361.1 hypothetical protein OGAPHI_005613 [Ogataea philodendri]